MNYLLDAIRMDLLDPKSLIGAVFYGFVFVGLATVLAVVIRRTARRVEPRLSDVTGLRFVSAFAQLLAYLVGFILYAHLVPELRALGTTLLAGVSIVSIVIGLAAQNTLGNLVAGLSLVLYRPIRCPVDELVDALPFPGDLTEARALGHRLIAAGRVDFVGGLAVEPVVGSAQPESLRCDDAHVIGGVGLTERAGIEGIHGFVGHPGDPCVAALVDWLDVSDELHDLIGVRRDRHRNLVHDSGVLLVQLGVEDDPDVL